MNRRRRGRLRKGRPARIPRSSRRLVPELPQSRSAAGSRSPSTPGDDDDVAERVPGRRRRRSARPSAPSAATIAGRRADVGAVAGALDPALAGGQRRPASSARWLIDLSPGRRSSPRSRAARTTSDWAEVTPVHRCRHEPRSRRRHPPTQLEPARRVAVEAADLLVDRDDARPSGRGTGRASSCCSASDSAASGSGGPRP